MSGIQLVLEAMDNYRHGWIDGAWFRAGVAGKSESYCRGYRDGRQSFSVAMNLERKRLGLPPIHEALRGGI